VLVGYYDSSGGASRFLIVLGGGVGRLPANGEELRAKIHECPWMMISNNGRRLLVAMYRRCIDEAFISGAAIMWSDMFEAVQRSKITVYVIEMSENPPSFIICQRPFTDAE